MMKNSRMGALLMCTLMIAVVFASIPVTAEESASSRAPVNHTVLAELFTATWCGPCQGADGAFDRIMDDSNYRPSKVALVQWHASDSYSDADDTDRRNYYGGIPSIPTAIFDGIVVHVGGSTNANNTAIDNLYKSTINARPATTPIDISVSKTLVGTAGTYDVTFSATDTVLNTSLFGRVILVEDDNDTIDNAKYRFTGKEILEDQAITLVSNGDTQTLSGTFTNSYDKYRIAIVAYVQDDSTKEVLQAKLATYPDNGGPIVTQPNLDFNMDEDVVDNHMDLDDVFEDPEGENMQFTIVSLAGTSHISTSKDSGNVVSFTPQADWSGVENFKITADDTYNGNKNSAVTFKVTVDPVNDVPIVAKPIADFSMNEGAIDKHIDLDNVFSDAETSLLTFDVTGNVELTATINPTTHIVTIQAPDAFAGVETLVFKATDEAAASVQDDVKITVKDVNYNPVSIAPFVDITIDEDTNDTSMDLDDFFSDEDGDVLQYTVSGNVDIITTIDTENVVTFTPNPNWNGYEIISIEASDNVGVPISDSLTVTVNSVNDIPEQIDVLEDIEMLEDNTFQTDTKLVDLFTDMDMDVLTFEVETQPDNVEVTIEEDSTVSFAPTADWNGETTVTILISDSTVSIEYEVPISVEAVNDGPVLGTVDPTSDVVMNEGDSKTFQVAASDIDLDVLIYEWYVGSDKQQITTQSFTYKTDSDDAGIHTIKAKVSDGVLEVIHEWKVTVKNVNNAPIVSITAPTTDAKIKAGKTTLKADISDLDGDDLTITWFVNGKAIPDSNKDSIEVKLTGGRTTIKVTVSDGEKASYDDVVLQVKATNKDTPGFELLVMLGAILVVFFANRRRK